MTSVNPLGVVDGRTEMPSGNGGVSVLSGLGIATGAKTGAPSADGASAQFILTVRDDLKTLHLRAMVELGGGEFCGVCDPKMPGIDALVLFNTRTGATCALKSAEVSADRVRSYIARQDELLELFCEKACHRVFSQFSEVAR